MNDIPERIVLLGATGFVGGAVLRQLQASANANNQKSPCAAHLLVHATPLENIPSFATVHRGSLAAISREVFPASPHVVLHCASKQTDRDGSGFDSNLQGIEALLGKINEHTRAIVFVSSYSVYGDDAQRDVNETAPLRPQSALAHSRVECEARLAEFARNSHCRVIICRSRFVLGADDHFVLPGIARLARARVKVGSGEQCFSIIDVDDFARILLALAHRAMNPTSALKACEIFNVGYTRSISLNAIYDALADTMPAKKPLWRIPVNELLLRGLNYLPARGAQQLVQKLRLIGLDHYGDVSKLDAQLGNDWLQSDPRAVVQKIALAFFSARPYSSPPHSAPSSAAQ